MAEVVPLSATVYVVGGGFHPVVVFGSIWRGSAVPLPRPEPITLATGPLELSLHEIEFVSHQREVGAGLIEVM